MKRTILILAALMASLALQAQMIPKDTLNTRIYFRVGSSDLDLDFRDNRAVLDGFVKGVNGVLRSGQTVESVSVETGASPEGGVEYNDRLAMDRARSIRKYLVDNLPLSASQIKAWSVGADWEGFALSVRSSDCPWKNDILRILADTGIRTDSDVKTRQLCQDRLKALDGGRAWRWMLDNLFEDLRQGAGTLRCIVSRGGYGSSVRDTLVIIHEYEGPDSEWYLAQASRQAAEASATSVMEQLDVKPRVMSSRDSLFRVPVLALRSNLLVPAMNVGLELPLGNRWSVGADWYYPWVWRALMNGVAESQSQCFELLGGSVDVRYWLGINHREREDCRKYRLRGHSVGLVLSGGYYDLEKDWTGRQGEYFAAGLGYKYALPVGSGSVHFEFEAAVGWGFSWYRGYGVHEPGGRLMGNWQDGFWSGPVPMKLGVNLVIPFFEKKNTADKED